MLRQIISPAEPSFILKLPEEMVGKTVEVIAFEIEGNEAGTQAVNAAERLRQIQAITSNSLVDLSNFKFDRNDANNYNE